jgi:hypothetical protein
MSTLNSHTFVLYLLINIFYYEKETFFKQKYCK